MCWERVTTRKATVPSTPVSCSLCRAASGCLTSGAGNKAEPAMAPDSASRQLVDEGVLRLAPHRLVDSVDERRDRAGPRGSSTRPKAPSTWT